MRPALRSFGLLLPCCLMSSPASLGALPNGQETVVVIGDRHVWSRRPEGLDQPPAPAAASIPLTESPRGVYLQGPFVSVQVNVNASGNNIVGDAANEPTITVNLQDRTKMAIAWRQFDTISSSFRQAGRAYTLNGGATWTFPGSLDPGVFRSDPVLDSDALGNFYFSSLRNTNPFTAQVFKSLDSGVTWGPAIPASGGDKQWLAVDDRASGMGAGHIYHHWNIQFSCCGSTDFTRSINAGASYQAPTRIPQPSMKWGTSDVGPDGTLYIAGATLNQTSHVVARSSNAKDPGVTPTFELVNSVNLGGLTGGFGPSDPNPGGLLGQVSVAADPSTPNRVYMLGSVIPASGNPMDVMFVRSANRGQSWSPPLRVNDDPASGAFHWFGTMSVAPNGRIDVIWNDTRNSGAANLSQTYYAFSVDTGFTWSANVSMTPTWNSHVGWPQQNKIGDYYHMNSDNGGASLAYATTFNGEQDVYFLRIPADCNGNGAPDDEDVAGGAPDCNDNEIPDTCEPTADCNSTGTQDICDIAAGSPDCNVNLVPDSCEGLTDCDADGQPDPCEVAAGGPDCNQNDVPDSCDITGGFSQDANGDSVPDECEGACCRCDQSCSFTTAAVCAALPGFYMGSGSSCASVVCGAPNNTCAGRTVLLSYPIQTTTFHNDCATNDAPTSVNCGGASPALADIWYQYVAPCTGTVRASLCGTTNFDSFMAVYGGAVSCSCSQTSTSHIACGDDTCGVGGGPSLVTFSATAGRCYLIRIAGWNGARGHGTLQISYDTACDPTPPAPTAASGEVDKNRALSVAMPTISGPGAATALRVRLIELQEPVPPNAPQFPPPDFSGFESGPGCTDPAGCIRWVGPPATYLEAQDLPDRGGFRAALLQCAPHYRNWSNEDPLHIIGAEVVPSSTYEAEHVSNICMGNEDTCPYVSAPLTLRTGRFGDVVAPFQPPSGTPQPEGVDVAALVNKFKSLPGAPSKPVAQLQPNLVDLNADRDALDIATTVDAFKGFAYPYSGPCPCPSPVACSAIPCDSNGDCSSVIGPGALCRRTCSSGANVGLDCASDKHCNYCIGGSFDGLPCDPPMLSACPGGACSGDGVCELAGVCRDACGRCTP